MRGSMIDLPKTVDVDELTIHETAWGAMHVSLVVCHKTLDISPLLKGLPDDMCQCLHCGMIMKGRKLVKYLDHEEVLSAGDAYYKSPGHSTITDPGTEWIEFSPRNELKITNEAVQRNLAELQRG